MSVDTLPPMECHRRAHLPVPVQQQTAYTHSYGHTAEFTQSAPPGSRPAYSRPRQATAHRQQSTSLPYLSISSHARPESFSLDPRVESSYIQRYLEWNGERMESGHQLPQRKGQNTRQGRPLKLRVSRSQPSVTHTSTISRSLNPSARAAHLRNPQPRATYLFPFDDSELAAVRSMWFDQGRRGLNLVEVLVRPLSIEDSTSASGAPTSDDDDRFADDGDDSTSSSTSTAPSALFDSTSLLSDTTASSVETVRSPAATTDKDKGKTKVAPRSPSRARTTTALSVNTSSDSLSLPRYTAVSAEESPLHVHAQAVLEGILDEQNRQRSHYFERKSPGSAGHSPLSHHGPETAPHKHSRRRRAQSVSESNLPTLPGNLSSPAALPRPLSWLAPVESFIGLVGQLPNAYIPTTMTPNRLHHSQVQSRPPTRHSHRRSASLPAVQPTSYSQPSRQTITTRDLDVLDHPPINLLPLPLHPPAPPRTPVIPPVPSLPRSPYRPINPPPTPTPRMRIVPNPQFLRLKAVQNRVLWGLTSVDREECEILRRVGIGMRGGPRGKDRPRGGGWLDEVDKEGRMCSGREARVGVAVEGRQGSILAYGDVLVMDESGDPKEVRKWFLSMTWGWTAT